MTPAFTLPPGAGAPARGGRRGVCQRRTAAISMVSVSRPSRGPRVPFERIVPDEAVAGEAAAAAAAVPAAPAGAEVAEVAAVGATVCEFMNREHLRDLAQYVVRFGKRFDDLSQLSAVSMTSVDAVGFTADVVSCDESHCVCVQERLDWPLGLCHNAGDIISALKYLSAACGLPADF